MEALSWRFGEPTHGKWNNTPLEKHLHRIMTWTLFSLTKKRIQMFLIVPLEIKVETLWKVRPGLEGVVDGEWCGWEFFSLEYFISWHLNFLAVESVIFGWANVLFQESLTPLSAHPYHLRWAILVSILSFATKWVWTKFDIWKFPISKQVDMNSAGSLPLCSNRNIAPSAGRS